MRSVLAGSWRFTLVSLAGFAPWIVSGGLLRRHLSEPLLYALCLLAFLIAAMALLPGLLVGDARVRRTAQWFLPAFTAYAVLWCACWFLLGGRPGEWTGALIGGSTFALITMWMLGRSPTWVFAVMVFVAAHATGYFAGGMAMHLLLANDAPTPLAMSAWAVCYGMGFGAGLGYVMARTRVGR